MNIISIDPSKANTGIHIKLEIASYFETINTTKQKEEKDKYLYIRKRLIELCKEMKIEVAFIEDYAYTKDRSMTALAEVKGVILITLYELNIPIIKVNPTTWQALCKLILPSRKNQKDYVKMVNDFYRKVFKTPDECDAYMMLLSMFYISQGVAKTDSHLKLKKKMDAIGKIF